MSAAYRSHSTVSLGTRSNTSFTAPSGIQNGDVLLLIMSCGHDPAVTVTPPSGFATCTGFPLSYTYLTDPYIVRVYAFYKVASSESGAYVASHSSADTEGILYAISGADTSTPITPNPSTVAHNGGAGSGGNVITVPSLTPAVDGSFVAWFGAIWDNFGAASPPSGSTPTFTERHNPTSGSICYAADGVLATAGATGSKAVTNTQNENRPVAGCMICVQAATGGGGTAHAVSATVSGSSPLAAELSRTQEVSATLTGSSTLVALLRQTLSLAASLQASSSVSATLRRAVPLSSSLLGSSAVAASMARSLPLGAALAGSSGAQSVLTRQMPVSASLPGSSAVTGVLQRHAALAALLSASSALTADLSLAGVVTLEASLSASSSLSATLGRHIPLSASLIGSSALSSTAVVIGQLRASLAATGSVEATLRRQLGLQASLAGTSSLAASAQRLVEVSALLAGVSSWTAAVFGGAATPRYTWALSPPVRAFALPASGRTFAVEG